MRVLIADDHDLFRDGLRSLLEARGIDVVAEARNGREAVDLARQNWPDIDLMDLSMPEMGGLAATRLISAELPNIKVVVLTAPERRGEHPARLLRRHHQPRVTLDDNRFGARAWGERSICRQSLPLPTPAAG
jgi:DNA-binding NarL/FixJ family response regulator